MVEQNPNLRPLTSCSHPPCLKVFTVNIIQRKNCFTDRLIKHLLFTGKGGDRVSSAAHGSCQSVIQF